MSDTEQLSLPECFKRQKIGDSSRERWQDPVFRTKVLKNLLKGRPAGFKHSEATKQKTRENHIGMSGKKHSIKTRQKQSQITADAWKCGAFGTAEWKQKQSDSHRGKVASEETRQKMSEATKRLWMDPEYRDTISKRLSGSNNPMYGKRPNQETRHKMSEAAKHRPQISEETQSKMSKSRKGKKLSEDTKRKISRAMTGPNGPNWQGGKSFEPYCPKFNFRIKEEIRNQYNRACVVCGKSEILNGRRLLVHHIDGDKMQGCNGSRWHLAPVCASCHNRIHLDYYEEFLFIVNTPSFYQLSSQ